MLLSLLLLIHFDDIKINHVASIHSNNSDQIDHSNSSNSSDKKQGRSKLVHARSETLANKMIRYRWRLKNIKG